MRHPFQFYILFLLLSLGFVQTQTTCSASGSTFYDGYLDTSIYYGSFQRSLNSYFKFTNPYLGITPLGTTSVSFWAKIPTLSSSASLQTGRFLDCSDIMSLRLINDTIKYDVGINSNFFTTGNNGTLSVQQFSKSLTTLQSWNNFAFSFNSGTMLMFLNGVNIGSKTIAMATLNTSASYCTIGNSLNSDDPLTGYLRYFYFSKSPWTLSTNVSNIVHHIIPTSSTYRLAYFQFSKTFFLGEQYNYDANVQYTYNGVSILQNSETEFVCYCTGTYGNFMNITSDYSLSPFTISQFSNSTIDSNGFIIDFQIYSMKVPNVNTEQILFSLNGYASIVLTNNSNTLRVDIYSSAVSTTVLKSVSFLNYNFRYNFWTQHTIVVSKTQAILYVDGAQTDKYASTYTFPSLAPTLTIQSPTPISYLMNNITLRNSKSVYVFNMTFLENLWNTTYQTQMLLSGSAIKWGQNNQLCYSTLSNLTSYWTGQNCIDRRLYPYFNQKSTTTSTTGTLLTSSLKSTQQSETIEIWLKDINSGLSLFAVIFENSLDGTTNPLIQLSLTTLAASSTSRTLTCSPLLLTQPSSIISFPLVVTYNYWVHFSCISDASSNSVTARYYNTYNSSEGSSTLNNILFYNQDSSITTSLGSSVSGLNKFTGYLREFRIWSSARTLYQIQTNRFQVIQQSQNTNLMYYFILSDQINPLQVTDSLLTGSNFIEQSTTTTTTINWSADTALSICQSGLYYNGNCCATFDISKASFQFVYSTSKNSFMIYLDISTISNNAYLFKTLNANFSVVAVGYNFIYDTTSGMTYLQYLQQTYFSANMTQEFNVSANLISTLASSITIQATIFSDYSPTTTVIVNKTLTLTCPMVWLSVLPNYATDSTQIVSLSTSDTQPQIYANIQNICYNTTTSSVQTITMSNVAWSSNVTSPKFATLYTISSDTLTASAVSNKSAITTTASYQKITATTTYNSNKNSITNSIYLAFQTLKITTTIGSNSTTKNLLQGDSLVMDLSSAAVSPSTNGNVILFSAICPSNAFYSTSSYNAICQISSTGVFTISNTSALNVVANYPYYFQVQMNINNTSVVSSFLETVTFYKDGGSTNCPKLGIQTSYSFSITTLQTLQILPDPYLYCSGTFFSVLSVNWTVTDSLTGAAYANLLSYGTQTIYRFANVTASSMTTNKIVSGQILNVNVVYKLSSTSSFSATTQIIFTQTPLVPVLQIFNENKTVVSTNTISFLSQNMIMNLSTSYDPDNSTANNFTYTWTCPSIVTKYYTCSSLVRGSANQYLYLNALQRAKIGFLYNTAYNFTVKISSYSNLYKTPVSKDFQVYFSPPNKNDTTSNFNMYTKCETVTASGGILQAIGSSVYSKVVKYDVSNYTNSWLNIAAVNNNTCIGTSTPVNEQIMFMYIFDGVLANGSPAQWLFEQNSSTSIVASQSFPLNMSTAFNLLTSTISFSTYYQANIYYFSMKSNSNDTVQLVMDTIYIYRTPTKLIASFVNSVVSVDKYDTLTLDASSSYDPDNLNYTYTYKWTCPNSASCTSYTGAQLSLTPQVRSLGNFNTNATTYTYYVQMLDSTRISATASAQVTITALNNYSSCVSVSMSTDGMNSFNTTTQTIYVQYNQIIPIAVVMNVNKVCDGANIDTPTFSIITPTTASSLTPWNIDSFYPATALIVNSQATTLTPGTNYTVQFAQTFSLGIDYTVKYSQIIYFNMILTAPDLVAEITAPMISYFKNSSSTIILDGSSSYDPALTNFTSSWACPSYFGGSSCQSTASSILSLTQSFLSQQAASNGGKSIDYYYNMSHPFILTLTSSDTRVQKATFYIFISSSSTIFTTTSGIESCGIYTLSSLSQNGQLPFDEVVTFYFDCPGNTNLSSSLLTNQTLTWTIDELSSNVDYFQGNSQLYLQAFSASKLSSNVITVGVQFSTFSNPVKAQFTMVYQKLVSGTVSSTPSTQIAYSQEYDFTFSNFYSTLLFGMQMQMRVLMDSYNSDQIIYPIKPFSNQYLTQLYQDIALPKSTIMYLDFFDMNFNYMGSYNLSKSTFSNMTLGSFTQNNFETIFIPLISKTSDSYTTTNSSKAQFEADYQQVYVLSDAINRNLITYNTSSTSGYTKNSDYILLILQYLSNTFTTQYYNYQPTRSPYDYESIVYLEKRVSYIIYNILISDIEITDFTQASSVLSIIDIVIVDFFNLIEFGNDQQSFRQKILYILQAMQNQVNTNFGSDTSEAQSNKLYMTQRIQTFYQSLTVYDSTKNLESGEVYSYQLGTSNIQMLQLDIVVGSNKQLKSTLNSNESVTISDQSILSYLNVNQLEVSFTFTKNDTSACETIIDIHAYDTSNEIMEVDFTSYNSSAATSTSRRQLRFSNSLFRRFESKPNRMFLQDSPSYIEKIDDDYDVVHKYLQAGSNASQYVTIQFQVKDDQLYLFNSYVVSADKETQTIYTPYCTFYNYTTNSWSTSGITTVSFDNSTGIIKCQTTHLSTFSVDYYGQSTAYVDSTTSVSDYYFQNEIGVYSGVIAGLSFIVLALIVISLKSYTLWDYNLPSFDQEDDNSNYGLCAAFCSTLLLYHPFVSAFCGPRRANIHTTMDKFNKMINIWFTFFILAFAVVLLFYLGPDLFDWTDWLVLLILGCVLFGVVFIGRIILNSLSYALYFKDSHEVEGSEKSTLSSKYSINKSYQDDSNQKPKKSKKMRSEEESLMSGTSGAIKKKKSSSGNSTGSKKSSSSTSKKSKSKKMREKYNFELEGGSSEDEYGDRYNNKKSKSRQQVNSNNMGGNSRSSSQQKELQSRSNKYGSETSNIYSGSGVGKSGANRDSSQGKTYNSSSNSRNLAKKQSDDSQQQQFAYSINDSAAEKASKSSRRDQSKEEKTKARNMINESNFRGASSPKKFNDSDVDQPPRKGKDMQSSYSAAVGNQGHMSKVSSESSYSKTKQQSSSLGQGAQSSSLSQSQKEKQYSSQFKERGMLKDKTKEVVNRNNKYGNNEDDQDGFNGKINSLKKSNMDSKASSLNNYNINNSVSSSNNASTIYRGQKGGDSLPGNMSSSRTESKASAGQPQLRDKQLSNLHSTYTSRINSTTSNFAENIDKSDKLNKNKSGGKKSKDKSKSQKDQGLEDTNSPHFNGIKMVVSIIKLLLLFSLMGLTFWLMRLLTEAQIYSWLEVFCGAFLSIVFVIDIIFTFLFAIVFKFAGPGKCSQVAGCILIGNGHRNLINGLLYELNNQ